MAGTAHDPEGVAIGAFGECMIELCEYRGELRQAYGGDTLNTLIYLARLLPALRGRLYYATGLGDDPFSERMLDQWRDEGIRDDHVVRVKGRLPGLYYVRTDSAGERSFHYWRGQAAVRGVVTAAFQERLAALKHLRVFYFSGISLAVLPRAARERLLAAIAALRAAGVQIAFDSNYRSRLWKCAGEAAAWMKRAYPLSDLALVSLRDETDVFGDALPTAVCERLAGWGVGEVVVRNGSLACTVASSGEMQECPPAATAAAVDTTAAGDAFNAAYMAARFSGEATRAAVAAAHRLAGRVVQFPGAIIPRSQTPLLENLL